VVCSNTWTTWVDARQLEPLPQRTAPVSGITLVGPTLAAAQSSPSDGLLVELGRALDRYRALVEELGAGRIDGATFRRQTFAARLLMRGGEAWTVALAR